MLSRPFFCRIEAVKTIIWLTAAASKTAPTDPSRSYVNWVVLDSDREAEFCRVVEVPPKVRAYVKNHNLGLGFSTGTAPSYTPTSRPPSFRLTTAAATR